MFLIYAGLGGRWEAHAPPPLFRAATIFAKARPAPKSAILWGDNSIDTTNKAGAKRAGNKTISRKYDKKKKKKVS